MIDLSTSYHVHTRWSDGSAAMSDYVKAAVDAGLEEIGFSDHYALLPDGGSTSWSIAPTKLSQYVAAVHGTASSAPGGMTVRVGLEVDFIPSVLSELRRALQPHDFDYLIGSVHIVDDFVVDGGESNLAVLPAAEADRVVRDYWTLIRQMADSRLFDIAGHLDVIEKGAPGFRPSFDMSGLVNSALDSIKDAGMIVELNTSGWHNPCSHAFPADAVLGQCLRRNIPVIVTADAHQPQHVARDFARAGELLQRVGYRSTAYLSDRHVAHTS